MLLGGVVVQYWVDLQSVHGLRYCGNITRTQNVSEYMPVLAPCLVIVFSGDCDVTHESGGAVVMLQTLNPNPNVVTLIPTVSC